MKSKEPKLRIGVLGGTFDPVHNGHLLLGLDALDQCGLDRLLFMPSARPPHKWTVHLSAANRLRLVRAAVAGEPRFRADDHEMRRRGPSYTWLTLRDLGRLHPGAELFWLIGADNVREIPRWMRAEEIRRRATLIIGARPGSRVDRRFLKGFRFIVLRARAVDISSTEIRERLSRNLPIHGLVPDPVERIIRQRKFYAQAPEKSPSQKTGEKGPRPEISRTRTQGSGQARAQNKAKEPRRQNPRQGSQKNPRSRLSRPGAGPAAP